MLKALYYPHTNVSNPLIIKNALLLWDALETIIPIAGWKPRRVDGDRLINTATDIIVQPRVPNSSEKREVHQTLNELAETGDLARLTMTKSSRPYGKNYYIFSDKFLDMTWHMLERGGMAQWERAASDYRVPPEIGFLMMSLLADACAGTQIQKITDRVDAYNWLSQQHARLLGSQLITGFDASQIAPAYDRLVTISLEVLDARAIPLRRLIEFRKRETKRGGSDYSAMRRRYLKALQAHIKQLSAEAKTESDVREINRQFKETLRHDIDDLKRELNLASLKTLFSTKVGISTLIVAGTLLSPISGLTSLGSEIGLVGIIPLIRAGVELRGQRRIALQKHIGSWLYLTQQGRLQIR